MENSYRSRLITRGVCLAGPMGMLAGVLIFLGSFGGGAIRYQGGLLRAVHMDFLAYGHGAGISNAVLWLGTVLLIAAWLLLGITIWHKGNASLSRIKRCIWVWIVPLFFAGPILSRDVYSYLMQGAMVRDGFNPYTEGAAVNPGPLLLEVSHDWRNTTTPYGPLHLWIGKLITSVTGDNVTAGIVAYKIVAIIGFAGIMWALPRLAEHLGASPELALWLGAANPVMILHMIAGMHNESLMVGLVSIGLVLALRRRFFAGIALVAIAVSLKATAAIAAPFMVWIAMHQWAQPTPAGWGLKRWVAWVVAAVGGAAETLGILAVVTWAAGTSWGWIAEISGNSKVINPLALPTLVAGLISDVLTIFDPLFEYNPLLAALRTAGSIAMLLGLVAAWWFYRTSQTRAIQGIAVAYALAFTLNAVTLPWYYASLITVVAVLPLRESLLRWATGLSIFIALVFTGSGNHQLYNTAWMAFAIIAALAGTMAIFSRIPGRNVLASPTAPAPTAQPQAKMPSLGLDAAPRGLGVRAEHRSDAPEESHLR